MQLFNMHLFFNNHNINCKKNSVELLLISCWKFDK